MLSLLMQELGRGIAMDEYKRHSEQIARTFCKGKDGKWYFISTIDRSCSSYIDVIFAETYVYEWDEENRLQKGIIAEFSSGKGSLLKHLAAVEQLTKLGYLIKDDA